MVGQSMSQAWDIYKRDFVAWTLFATVVGLVGTVIPVLGGLLLLPTTLRETKKAINETRAPDIAALFDFSHFGTDFGSMALYALAQTVGLLMCFVGWPFAWFFFWFTAELAADDRVSVTDGMRLSMAWTSRNIGETMLMMLVSVVIATIAGSVGIGIGIFFALPFIFIMWAVYWGHISPAVYDLAARKGMHVQPEHYVLVEEHVEHVEAGWA